MTGINNSINNTLQTPFKLGAVSVTSTGTQLNYLSGATSVSGSGALVLNAANSGANSDITSLTGLNGVIQAPTFINDTNGNHILGFSGLSSAVNYLEVQNSRTASGPTLITFGTDSDIDMLFVTKGTGQINLNSANTTRPLIISSGTALQHATIFDFANTAASRVITFQDASGTLCMDTSSSGSLTTAPPVSASSTLAVGTAYQNTLGYDIVLTVYIAVTAATAASILLGVGPTTTPTQQTIVSALTTAALVFIPVTIYLPNNYYALLSTSGTITQTISGQQAMPV